MPALLSFDTEFTHPVSTMGGLMQIGCVIVPWNLEVVAGLI
jgi:hypothetical protein